MKLSPDVSLYAEAYASALRAGQEGNLLVMNFMTGGGPGMGGSDGPVRSNTLNPFTGGFDVRLTQVCVGLMDDQV